MARNGSGVYSLPANTAAVSGDTISSTKWNSLTQDLEADMNVDRPIVAGGTGASTALAALTNLFSGASPGGADKIGFWDQSASAFGWLSLGTGLSFNGTSLDLDADLSTLAGLAVAADNFIVGNSGGTAWEVKTPTQARTSLGLGTAAVKNTGTSGDAVPLLNGTNTFSGNLSISKASPILDIIRDTTGDPTIQLRTGSRYDRIQNVSGGISFGVDFSGTEKVLLWSGTALTVLGSTVWHAGNDGAGSGLDADTLDGVQGSAYATLANPAFTGNVGIGVTGTVALEVGGAAPNTASAYPTYKGTVIVNEANLTSLEQTGGIEFKTSTFGAGYGAKIASMDDGVIHIGIRRNSATWTRMVLIDDSGIQARAAVSSETSGTLTIASANKTIRLTGNPTINNSVFAAGDIIVMYAGSAARTITAGTITTMRLDGTATTGSRTLAARGMAVLFFVSSSEVVVSGGAVS